VRGSLGAVCVMMQCYVMYSLLSYDLKYYVMGWMGCCGTVWLVMIHVDLWPTF
jgi:hypothetical protein